MKVSAQYAQEHFSDILNAADSGEEVEIARPDKPTLKIVFSSAAQPVEGTGKRILGAGRGEMIVPTDEEWQAMDEELEREMIDAPLITSGEI
jgi:antitoxin (DNA-binding transcriptional repressor) of toxin-antitoxin stability system